MFLYLRKIFTSFWDMISLGKKGSFANLRIDISASALALTSASASALQKNFFFLAKFLFYLSKFLMKKTSIVKSFSSTLAHFLRVSATVLRSYSVENLLAPASEEWNSTVEVISKVLNKLTSQSWVLHVCEFLIKNHIRDNFLEIFFKF